MSTVTNGKRVNPDSAMRNLGANERDALDMIAFLHTLR
jgi:hypothetical protein